MKKYVLFILLFLGFSFSISAQDLEYTVAVNACDCLSDVKGELDEVIVSACVSTAFANELGAMVVEDAERFNTASGISSSLMKVYEILQVICFEDGEQAYLHMESKYYSESDNKEANKYYYQTLDLMEEGKLELAIEGLEIAVSLDSLFVLAYDNLGVCYRQTDDLDNAILNYKKSLEMFPLSKMMLQNIGLAYAFKEDYETSNLYYNRLIDVHPNYAEGYYGIGKNYAIIGEYKIGLTHICTAHKLYIAEDSDFQDDSEQLLGLIYEIMKEEGKEKIFKKTLRKNKVKIYIEK